MTRRIALSILLTVWAMLIASGVTAYLTTREVLLRDLDDTLVAQASALPELVQAGNGPSPPPAAAPAAAPGTAAGRPGPGDGDRYLIQTATDGRTVRPRRAGRRAAPPTAPGRPARAGGG